MSEAGRPRLGFLGVGWIGRNRMEAALASGLVEVAAVSDPSPEAAAAAAALSPGARIVDDLPALLDLGLDGLVIATPSALHAAQAVAALERGTAVFCQKPLGRVAGEVEAAVEAARRADRLLSVDLSYRHTEAMRRVREVVRSGELGRILALDLVFHNAYGPDKPWFYDPVLSGGGCVMDLGVHLVDLAFWLLDGPALGPVSSHLRAGGLPLAGRPVVEDYAAATLELGDGVVVRLACSWRLHAGRDALISAEVYGTEGGAAMRNCGGSFYDFTGERYRGTATETLAAPPDAWGGRAVVRWAERLAAGERFAPQEGRELLDLARAIDAIYDRAASPDSPSRDLNRRS